MKIKREAKVKKETNMRRGGKRRRQLVITQADLDKLMHDFENNTNSFEHLKEKMYITNSLVLQKLNTNKIEKYFSRKFNPRERQITNNICLQMRQKLEGILKRETHNLLNKWNLNSNLKVLDHLRNRAKVLQKLGKDPYDWYDEEQDYLDDMHAYLTEYLKKI